MTIASLSFLFLGTFIGSFLNVLVDRLSKGQSIAYPPSHCPHCNHRLSVLDLIPILSFLFLKGKCRYCRKPISFYYPAVELVTGVLFAFTVYFIDLRFMIYDVRINDVVTLLFYLFTVSVLIVIFFADLKYGLIPFAVVIPVSVITLLFVIFNFPLSTFNYLASAIVAALFFYLIGVLGTKVFKQESMGFGDVVLAFYLGLLLGFPKIVLSFYTAFLTGAVISSILIVIGRKKLKGSTVPFGPFLVLGAFISLFWGDTIVQWFARYLMTGAF